jgi:integrase
VVSRWEEYLKISGWESDYNSVNNLLRHLRYRKTGSEGSRELYCRFVYAFCKYTGKNPDDLVALEKADVEKLIENYCYHKMESGWKSPRTANAVLFSLKTFFKVNDFRGSRRLDIDCFRQSVRERTKQQYIPTLDEARTMAAVAGSLRNRAIILFLSSTGLRNSTLRALQYGEVREELEKGVANILIRVHKGMKKVVNNACKGGIEYFVFTSGETTEALRLYLNDRRKRLGELHDDDVLFCAEYNQVPRNLRALRPLTSRELQLVVKEAARKASIKEWNDVYPYCLRKTFDSLLRSQFADGGRLDQNTKEFFMGHILRGSMDTYFDKTKVEALRKEYSKLIFKSRGSAGIEALDSLQGIARVLGIDVAKLEEARKKELGRALNDLEKLSIVQEAIKQLLS